MKKRSSKVVVALILAMTMLMGMSMTVMADQGTPAKPVAGCTKHPQEYHWLWDGAPEDTNNYWYGTLYGYDFQQGKFISEPYYLGEVDFGGGERPDDKPTNRWWCYMEVEEGVYAWRICNGHNAAASSSHTHNYEWNTLVDPTTEQDGVEAYICSCGDIQATQPISAAHHILKVNADAVKNAKAGATVVVELGRLNSLPRWFVTKLVERDDLNITLKITYNNENYTLDVPTTATIEDESIEWYGPLKLMSMFPQK